MIFLKKLLNNIINFFKKLFGLSNTTQKTQYNHTPNSEPYSKYQQQGTKHRHITDITATTQAKSLYQNSTTPI